MHLDSTGGCVAVVDTFGLKRVCVPVVDAFGLNLWVCGGSGYIRTQPVGVYASSGCIWSRVDSIRQ